MQYRKLPGHRRGLLHSASLWLADDHLLSVKGVRVREEYKRFHFRDIQAIVIADAPRYHISTRALAIGAAWLIAFIFALAWASPARTSLAHGVFWPIFVALVITWLYISGACSCRCRIFTAVSREDLPSIYRTWTARRFIEQLEPHILAAQQAMPENWLETVDQRVIGPPELASTTPAPSAGLAIPGAPLDAPRPPARGRSPISDLFVASLLADAIILGLTLQTRGVRIQWAIYALAIAKLVTAILVLVQCYRRKLAPAMQRLAVACLLVMGCLYYVRPVLVSAQAQANANARAAPNQEALALFSFPSALREADAIASGILGLIGGFLTVAATGRQPDSL